MPKEAPAMRTKTRSEKEFSNLISRLNRIEGQIRGIKKMVEQNAYCPDILTQTTAAKAALSSFSKELLLSHIKSCVVNDIKNGNADTVDELCDTIKRMMK